jgi:hypothetical protein
VPTKKTIGWLVAVLLVAAAIALLYYWVQKKAPSVEQPAVQNLPLPASEVVPAPPASTEPKILYPVIEERPPEQPPLPTLRESDGALREALAALSGGISLAEIGIFSDLVRRIVATVDNLPRQKVAQRLLPVKNAKGLILVSRDAEGATLMPQNSARYAEHMRIVEAVDAKQLVALYVRFYPLFQQAYRDLGYPKGYFNDRLVEVIDHLLAAPEVTGPLRLVQPKVMYKFADPELEALSAGQKILIRVGSENATRLKAKLRAIRGELVSQAANPPS